MGEWLPLEELRMDRDGSKAYRFPLDDQSSRMAESWESAAMESDGMEWSCEPDDLGEDDLDVPVSGGLLADLVRRAATCCPTCDGSCAR